MKREIKFRAWDGQYSIMHFKVLVGNVWDEENYTAHSVYLRSGYTDYKIYDPGHWCHFDEHSNFVLMQFTGLKDKNGKEIYEGDICKTYDHDNGFTIDVVEFEDGSFVFKHPMLLSASLRGFKTDYIEVIGNIYEQPELLK